MPEGRLRLSAQDRWILSIVIAAFSALFWRLYDTQAAHSKSITEYRILHESYAVMQSDIRELRDAVLKHIAWAESQPRKDTHNE